jgi:hypothetical protein
MIYSNVFPTEGQPYRLLPVTHNWSSPFRVTYEYKTDVMVSGNGREQRRAVRMNPRRTFEYTVNYSGDQKYILDRFLDRSPRMLAIVPEENLTIRSASRLNKQGASVNYLGGLRDWMQLGQMVIINDNGRCETRTIDAFNANTLFFTEKNDTVFPAGVRISVARFARLNQDPTSVRMSGLAGTMSLSALIDPGSDGYAPSSDGAYFLGFREYLNTRTDWGQSPQVTHAWAHEDIDYGYGRIGTYTPIKFPQRVAKTNYWAKGWKNNQNIIDFFGRMKGRNREFFYPSYERSIPYYAAAGITKAILVKGLDFAYTYKDSPVFRRIVIRKKDGTDIHMQVDYIEALPDTDTSVVWLTDFLPDTDLSPADTYGIWWVTVARFATDRLDVDWITDDVAQFAFNVQNLENLDV